MGELENRFDAIDARKDGKQDVGRDFAAKKEAQRAFYQFAIKDAQGQVDMRHPYNIQLIKDITTLLHKQDLECYALTQYIENQMQTIKSESRQELTQEQVEVQKLANYFSIDPKKLQELTKTLKEGGLDLDVLQLLEKYQKYIDENLKSLEPKYLQKVKGLIALKTLNITKEVSLLKRKESDMTQFQNNRWIINKKILGEFERLDKAILPSCVFYVKYSQKTNFDQFMKEYNKKHPAFFAVDTFEAQRNAEKMLVKIKDLLESSSDDDDTWYGFIFDERQANTATFLEEAQIPKIEEITLLSEKDKKIQEDADFWFVIAVLSHIGAGIIPLTVVPAAGVDLADMFTSTEVLLEILQKVGLVDPSYRMEKTLIDNIFAGLGIIPGVKFAIKGPRVQKFLSKFPKEKVAEAMETFQRSMGDFLKGRTKLTQELGYTTQDIKKYTSMSVEDMLRIATREEREKAAEIILGQKLTQKQKDVIWEAHLVGKAPFSFSDIKEKVRILTRDKIFKENERKRLLQKGVCGEDIYYDLARKAVKRYKERISGLTVDDIIDYGANAVVVRSKMDGRVYKLPLSEFDEPKLLEESMNHDKFFKQLREGKKTKQVPDNIHIPEVHTSPLEDKGLYSMQHIEGQTLGAKFTLRNPKYAHLFPEPPEFLNTLTGSQIKKRLKDAKISDIEIDRTMTPPGDAFDLLKSEFPDKPDWLRDIQKAVDYLKKYGLEHTDFHAGNIMFTNKTDEIAKEGDIFIIDFGKVDVPSIPKPSKN